MARWRLITSHYLNVPGTEWERVEVSRETGKQARVRHPVHRFLNPMEPTDNNYPGETIVAHEGKGQRNDIIFVGPPTPDMEPLDDEAVAINAQWADSWKHPIDTLPATGEYSQSMILKFERDINDVVQKAAKGENVSVNAADFETLKRQVAELALQNAQLKEKKKPGRPKKVQIDSPV